MIFPFFLSSRLHILDKRMAGGRGALLAIFLSYTESKYAQIQLPAQLL